MRKPIYAALTVLLTGATLWAQAASTGEESPFKLIPELTSELARITALKPLKKVQYSTMSRADLRKYLEQKVKEELKPEEIRVEELALKKFGLVPQNFALAATMVDVMTEQAEAFYDYRQKKLFLVEGESANPIQNAALLHELAHALADQHFQLEKFIRKGKSDDSTLARTAVMEGQATWIMYEWMASKAGQSLRKLPALAQMIESRSADITGQYPVLGNAPLYLRASLLFPYAEGLRFQQAVIEKYGDNGFAEVFRNPPVDTQQILHPELYFNNSKPREVKLPKPPDAYRYKELMSSTVGEFDHAILLQQYGSRELSDRLSPKWRGGQIALYEAKSGRDSALLYASEWESAEDAREMFKAYRQVLEKKWKKVTFTREAADQLEGIGDDGIFRLSLDGTRISSIEGLPEVLESRIP